MWFQFPQLFKNILVYNFIFPLLVIDQILLQHCIVGPTFNSSTLLTPSCYFHFISFMLDFKISCCLFLDFIKSHTFTDLCVPLLEIFFKTQCTSFSIFLAKYSTFGAPISWRIRKPCIGLKSCDCCSGHSLTISHYIFGVWVGLGLVFNLSRIVNCVTKSLYH